MKPGTLARLKALIAVITWGGSLPAIKVAVAQVSFPTVIWFRFGSGVAALVVYLILRGGFRLLSLRETAIFAALGFLGVFFHNAIQAFALQSVSAGMSGLIIAANPVAIAILGYFILGEKLDGRKKGGILLAAFGVLVILSRGNPFMFFQKTYSPGELILVFSVFTWGLFSVYSRRVLQKTPTDLAMTYVLTFGWLFATPLFLYSGGVAEISTITAPIWGNILFLGVFCSALAYLFWYDALKDLPASEAGVFLYVNPVVAILLSAILLGERLSLPMIGGGLLVFAGVWFVNSKQKNIAERKADHKKGV